MRRDRCGGCGSPALHQFLDLGSSPLADRFPATADEPEQWYPLQVAVCDRCWLVQLLDVVPDDELYGSDYGFYTGSAPSAVAYFAEYAAWAADRFDLAGKLVVEVACNDGTLLVALKDRGAQVLGVEPADGPAGVARAQGLTVHGAPFGREAAKLVGHGRADLVVANNVAAHVADLDDFFAGMAALVAPGGAAVVEVQNLVDLMSGNQFDHVYHEHRYYFSADSLRRVMARHGLHVRDMVATPAQGGSVRVVAIPGEPAELRFAPEPQLQWASFRAFQGRVDRIRDRVNALVDEQIAAGRKVAGYAASAKSATLLNFCGLGPDRVDHVADTTPHKVGRYTPGTKVPIVAPGERPWPDVYLLLAWNYLPGVLRREQAYLADGRRFLVPIPYPVLL